MNLVPYLQMDERTFVAIEATWLIKEKAITHQMPG